MSQEREECRPGPGWPWRSAENGGGEQEEEWEGEKAVQPEDSLHRNTTPQISSRQHNLHKVLTKKPLTLQLCHLDKKPLRSLILEELTWDLGGDHHSSLLFFPPVAGGADMEEYNVFVRVELPREFIYASLLSRISFSLWFCTLTITLLAKILKEKGKYGLSCYPLTFYQLCVQKNTFFLPLHLWPVSTHAFSLNVKKHFDNFQLIFLFLFLMFLHAFALKGEIDRAMWWDLVL